MNGNIYLALTGGDATPHDAFKLFRFFDNDREGVISVDSLRTALRRLNVDPTDAAFDAFAAKHDPQVRPYTRPLFRSTYALYMR